MTNAMPVNPHSYESALQWICPCGEWLDMQNAAWRVVPAGCGHWWAHRCAPGLPDQIADATFTLTDAEIHRRLDANREMKMKTTDMTVREAVEAHPIPKWINAAELVETARIAHDAADEKYDSAKAALAHAACAAVGYVVKAHLDRLTRPLVNPHSSDPVMQMLCPCGEWLDLKSGEWEIVPTSDMLHDWAHRCAGGTEYTVADDVRDLDNDDESGGRDKPDYRTQMQTSWGHGLMLEIVGNKAGSRWFWTLRSRDGLVDQGRAATEALAQASGDAAFCKATLPSAV